MAKSRTDAISGRLIAAFGNALFDPYGIQDPELFLSSLSTQDSRSQNIVTVKLESDSEEPIILSVSGNDQLTQKSLTKEMKPKWGSDDGRSEWITTDGDINALFENGSIALGSNMEIQKFKTRRNNSDPQQTRLLAESEAPIATIGRDHESASQIVDVLSAKKSDDARTESSYFTETHFTKAGLERRTVSDFGLIGLIIAQLGEN